MTILVSLKGKGSQYYDQQEPADLFQNIQKKNRIHKELCLQFVIFINHEKN